MPRFIESARRALPLVFLLSTGCMHRVESLPTAPNPPAGSASPARKPATTPLGKLNEHFRTDYGRVQAAVAEQLKAGPLLWMRGTQLILRNRQAEQTHPVAGSSYHVLKSISHAPFLLVVTLVGNEGPSLTDTSRKSLLLQRQLIADVLAALSSTNPQERPQVPEDLLEKEKALLQATSALIDETLASGPPSRERLESFAVGVRPTLRANLQRGAREFLENLHRRVTEFRAEIGEEQWARIRVLVSVAHQSRAREISVQYFERVLGERMGEGASGEDRLVVSEDFVRGQAIDLLSAHELDREAGAILLGNPKQLQSDVLAEVVPEILDELRVSKQP